MTIIDELNKWLASEDGQTALAGFPVGSKERDDLKSRVSFGFSAGIIIGSRLTEQAMIDALENLQRAAAEKTS